MANILHKIIDQTRKDLMVRNGYTTLSDLRSMPLYGRNTFPLKKALSTGSGIIAEHKRQSPSKGSFNCPATVVDVVSGYEKAGASAISCLTDTPFFGGTLDDLKAARAAVSIPILRKDFIVDLYQIHESRAYGADAILLIASCLNNEELKTLSLEAINLGLSILFEVHDLKELNRLKIVIASLPQESYVMGVNNRNLTTFITDIDNSLQLLPHFPKHSLAVSESGLSDPATVVKLRNAGFQGFLIGENFMKSDHPGATCNEFIKNMQHAD